MKRRLAAVPVALLLALAGCTPTPPDDVVGASRDAVPDDWAPDADSAECGALDLGLEADVPADAWACIDDARAAGEPAHLGISRPTDEGDPVIDWYLVRAGAERIEVLTDWRYDEFGPGGWAQRFCSEASVAEC